MFGNWSTYAQEEAEDPLNFADRGLLTERGQTQNVQLDTSQGRHAECMHPTCVIIYVRTLSPTQIKLQPGH